MYTGVSFSLGTSSFWLIKCASLCFISACCVPKTVCGCSRYICIPSFVFPTDVIVPPHPMCVCLTFAPFSPPRGAGGGDGESRDGGSPRETETPAQTPRALPVPPTGVFTCHTHQVHCCAGIIPLNDLFQFVSSFYFSFSNSLSFPQEFWTHTVHYFDSKYLSHAVNKASIQFWASVESNNPNFLQTRKNLELIVNKLKISQNESETHQKMTNH